jgi:acetylglutamate kinase
MSSPSTPSSPAGAAGQPDNGADLVLRFLASIGRREEAEYYVRLFRHTRPESFAIIAVGEAVLRGALDALIADLRFLWQLGLLPVIAIGLPRPRDAGPLATELARRLAPAVRCEITTPAQAATPPRHGAMALVPLSGLPARASRRFDALAAMATALQSRKLVFLGRRSGLAPHGEAVRSLVDLTREYDELMAPGVLSRKQAALLAHIRRIIEAVPHRMTAAVTSPLDLLRELFTVRGAGTLVRRGSQVVSHRSFATCDRERLTALIRSAFGRPVQPHLFAQAVRHVYIADDYRGAAIVTATALGPYLSKFAVDVGAQGEGIGRDLWRALVQDAPQLFWRTRTGNPFASWYEQQCDGMHRSGAWQVFWRGFAPDAIPALIAHACAAPVDFGDS